MFGFIYSTMVVLMYSVLIPDMLDLSEFEYEYEVKSNWPSIWYEAHFNILYGKQCQTVVIFIHKS